MDHGLKIVVWNVRGHNARARLHAIRRLLDTTDASIVCLQETKMELIHSSVVLDTLGSEFDDYTYVWRHSPCVEKQGHDYHGPFVHHQRDLYLCRHGRRHAVVDHGCILTPG